MEEFFRNKEVPGRGDRKEFGQPLDDAENDRHPDVVHDCFYDSPP
jgi:hypothetical protein